MFSSLYLTLLAFVVAMVSAQTSVSATTTSTLSLTETITLTRCNPTVTNCPANRHNTTTSTYYPASNTSTVAWPTTYHNKTTSAPHVASTGFITYSYSSPAAPVVIASTPAAVPATPAAPAATSVAPSPPTVATSGAQALFVQSGLFLSGLAGAIALLA